jgi:cardiolipin synthase A/B
MIALLGRWNMQKERSLLSQLHEIQVGDNSLQLYRDGNELSTAMLAAIDEAQESIFLEASIWRDDETGRAFKQHLSQKVAQGVEVYVICGNLAKQKISRAFGSFPAGVHILRALPFRRPWHVLDPRRYAPDHRKLLVVDGVNGFIGGFHPGSPYRHTVLDTNLQLRGPATADLAYVFIEHWNRFSSPREQITHRYRRVFNPFVNIQANDALRLTFPIRDMYIEAIDRAEQSIFLTNASFVPDHSVLEALTAAVARGVDVRVLVPWPSNAMLVDRITCSSFTQCLQAGTRLYGSRLRRLRSKTCTIDGQWSTIGSAHLDLLSSVVNYELNIEVYDVAFATQMQLLFAHDIAEAQELSLTTWLNRPWYWKLSERALAPFRFLL